MKKKTWLFNSLITAKCKADRISVWNQTLFSKFHHEIWILRHAEASSSSPNPIPTPNRIDYKHGGVACLIRCERWNQKMNLMKTTLLMGKCSTSTKLKYCLNRIDLLSCFQCHPTVFIRPIVTRSMNITTYSNSYFGVAWSWLFACKWWWWPVSDSVPVRRCWWGAKYELLATLAGISLLRLACLANRKIMKLGI